MYLSSFNASWWRLPHTNITELRVTEPNSVYCPAGASVPLTVRPGYYTVGNNRTTRFDQEPCPMGSYCLSGYECSYASLSTPLSPHNHPLRLLPP